MRELYLQSDKPYVPNNENMIHYGSGHNSVTITDLKVCYDARKEQCPYALK